MKLISSFWTVIIISISVAVIFLSYGFFHEWKPKQAQAKYDNDLAQQLQQQADMMPQAKKRDEKAIAIVKEKTAQWNEYVAVRTPATSLAENGIDISEDPYKLARDTWVFRDSIQSAINAQLKKGGVKLVGSGPLVPTPTDVDNVGGVLSSFYHYPGIKFPVVILNLGQIQVKGTYQQISDHINAYKTMPHYLAVTDGLRFDGTAPELTATYSLSVVGFIRGTKVFGTIPEAVASTTGGFGGGRGGPAGGMGLPPGVGAAGAGRMGAGRGAPGATPGGGGRKANDD